MWRGSDAMESRPYFCLGDLWEYFREGRRRGRAGGCSGGGIVKSLVMCSTGAVGVDDDDHEEEDIDEERIEIANVPHVSHIAYDHFGGFLGLPVDLELDVPRRTPNARVTAYIIFKFVYWIALG